MFNRNKEANIRVNDLVWTGSTAKWKGLIGLSKNNVETTFIFWFDDSLREAEDFLRELEITGLDLVTVREAHHITLQNRNIIFAEHYPIRKKEQEIFQSLHLTEVTVLSSLDEALFKKFGANNITELLRKLGLDENESIQHGFITGAIKHAQEKIESSITVDLSARSQSEWFENNLPGGNS
jgi:hypothetical protein